MDSDMSEDLGTHGTGNPRSSVSMALRPLQRRPARIQPEEISESDEEEEEEEEVEEEEEEEEVVVVDERGNDTETEKNDAGESPSRRDSISSAGSQYSPSATSSSHDGNAPLPDHRRPQAEPASHAQPPLPSPHPRRRNLISPSRTVPPTPVHRHRASPLKRSLSPEPLYRHHSSPTPGAAAFPTFPTRPLKRHKPTATAAAFNPAYLALLNEDIHDAAARFTPHDDQQAQSQVLAFDLALEPSQTGLTHWSAAEKTLLFDALARLGRDDLAGVAAQVRTKSPLEVGAYVAMLSDESSRLKRRGGGGGGGGSDGVGANAAAVAAARVTLADVPAAVEVSQACCAALEEAADAVAARQEAHEEKMERKRWGGSEDGGEYWLIGPGNRREVERTRPDGLERSLGLFRVRNWLQLSERVFMNAAVDEYNWAKVSGNKYEKPAMRATALDDFYSVAVSVTKRLVAATLFVAESRLRTRRMEDPLTRSKVRKRDAEAAALSLGLPTNSHNFWAKCARRLRLEVYDDDDDDDDDGGGGNELEPMVYDEVERSLGLRPEGTETDSALDEAWESSGDDEEGEDEVIHDDEASVTESDNGSIDLGDGNPYTSEDERLPSENSERDEAERAAVMRELNELLVHSALEYPKSRTARDGLRNRIRAERAHEAYADSLDRQASYQEEKRLWALLGRRPPVELVKPEAPGPPPKWTKKTVGDLVEAYSRTSGGWRGKLEVVPSRWEMEYALAEEEKGRGAQAAEAAAVTESGAKS